MIGRKKEIEILNTFYNSNKAEFVAVYGRRRIGKTFLIEDTFKKKFAFRHTGIYSKNLKVKNILKFELTQFYNSLVIYGLKDEKVPNDWFEAFSLLRKLLDQRRKGSNKKQVVFLDELPWLDTSKSNFISALEFFWNNYGSGNDKLLLIVCGSASSWILDNLIHNIGGLYNRITCQIKLKPFTLKECEELLKSKNIKYSRYEIIKAYMVFGGIPYYLNLLDKSLSVTQNINNLFFKEDSILKNEFDNLFSSTFASPEQVKSIIFALSEKNIGLKRDEILKKTKLNDNGHFSHYLSSLIESDYIVSYNDINNNTYYKLIDSFSLFYLKFKEYFKINDFFLLNFNSPIITTWYGLNYEIVCFNHINKIKEALGISAVSCEVFPFFEKNNESGAQIDLILKRRDNILNICEIKYYKEKLTISKKDYLKYLSKTSIVEEHLNKKQSILNVLITSFGVNRNEYSFFFNDILTLDDLF